MKKNLRTMLRALCCVTVLLCAMTVVASASVASEIKDYAKKLANENGAKLGSIIEEGSGKNEYTLGSLTASNGRGLYVVELQTIVGFERQSKNLSMCHMDCAIFYLGSDNKVYWTEDFHFNEAAEKFLDKTAAMKENANDAISIQLPSKCEKILAFYFHKAGAAGQANRAWSGKWLRIAKVSGSIGSIIAEDDGYRFRNYSGEFMAGIANLNELNEKDWGHHLWRLNQVSDPAHNSCDKSFYVVEMVAGSDGYPNKKGKITINYTDSLGLTYDKSITFDDGYEKRFPGNALDDAHKEGNWGVKLSSDWLKLTDRQITGLASGYVGNYYTYDKITDTCLLPYTATNFWMVLPQNISKINRITVKLDENDTLNLQSVRFIELSKVDGENYWNGSFGLERISSWKGQVIAQSNGTTHTVPAKGAYTFEGTTKTRGFTSYERGTGPWVDNTGNGVGVTIQFADVLGAGVESLLSRNKTSYTDKQAKFNASAKMNSQVGSDAWKAYFNLCPFYQESMTLELTYKDTLGATRKVSVPYMTSYILYNLLCNNGKLTGGSSSTWIAGLLQQNENAALALRLAQYESMVSVKLTHGAKPYGFVAPNLGTIDASSDTIAVENICIYEGVTTSNFSSKYDSSKLAVNLNTSLQPAYSWVASSAQGQKLGGGGSVSASVSEGTLEKGAPEQIRSEENKYVIAIRTADLNIAGTNSPIALSVGYTSTQGGKKNTSTYSGTTLASNFYGMGYRNASSDDQYKLHMRQNEVCEFVVEIPDAATIDSVTLTLQGADEWQLSEIWVYKLEDLKARTGSRSGGTVIWDRSYSTAQANKVAHTRQSILLYSGMSTKTVYFTTYDEEGNATKPELESKKEEYLISMPTTMTYDDTMKNLGLSVTKYTYRVDVKVNDVEDAGSTNYFYFQLVFENGTSGVVLANQQLASDAFRQGATESFQIKTTQNYGNVMGVRIICDNTSSNSDVFDKLNIDNISVTLSNNTGISKTWKVENVGWIDITYVDEGANQAVEGLEALMVENTLSNAELVKEFAINRTATAVDLLFCLTTANTPSNVAMNSKVGEAFRSLLDGGKDRGFEATLIYLDSDGVEQSRNFDLLAAIQEYNDTADTSWLLRPNHVDRFRLSMTDISSVLSLVVTQKTSGKWDISSVSIQQIGGLGDVYLSPQLQEYYRDTDNAVELAQSTNGAGVYYTVSSGQNAMITFTENKIDVASQAEQDAWNATITRVPMSTSESLNIILFPGSIIGQQYTFTESSPPIRSTVKYTTIYGGSLMQNAYTLGHLGEVNGQRVMYGKQLAANAMSTLSSMLLSTTDPSNSAQPVIGKAIVQRVRDNVIMGNYLFDYGSYPLSVGNPEYSPQTAGEVSAHQVLTMQPAAGQSHLLTAETSDVAVALRYTSSLDPAEQKTVYQTPYVYFTDANYTSINTGQNIEIPFNTEYVGEVVGISIISTGPMVSFDNAVIHNYSGAAGSENPVRLNSCYLAESFMAMTMETVVTADDETVIPAVFRFTTAAEDMVAGSGTSGQVNMIVQYTTNSGNTRSVEVSDLLRYLPADQRPVAGSTVEIPFMLSDIAAVESITLSADDGWFLTEAAVDLALPDGVRTASTTVNNWARTSSPLEIKMNTESGGNYIQSFSVTGRAQNAGIAASAAEGGALLVTAYPGDTVYLKPAITAMGNPDLTWAWNMGKYDGEITVDDDGVALFRVPSRMRAGDSCSFSVTCNGDNRRTVSITIAVEAEPLPEPEPDWDSGFGGGGGDSASDTAGGATGGDTGGADTGGGGEA